MQSTSLHFKVAVLTLFLVACGSSSKNNGAGGAGGDNGAGGALGGGTGGATVAFMAVEPCPAESDYVASPATVSFPNGASMSYSPKCLKVAVGDTVTFMASEGTFAMHPLEAARRRGDTANNPITTTMTSDSARAFTFSVSGFYAYYCAIHGASDDGSGEAGVIWVH